jgi:hypothetical protein
LSTNNPLKAMFLKGYFIFRATQRATFII